MSLASIFIVTCLLISSAVEGWHRATRHLNRH